MNPHYGDFDTYHMAASAIDEAVRNCVAVGADPGRIAILDNFCWGNTDRPQTLGSLVRAALACHDSAIALGTPFISGKDSLNNEFRHIDAEGETRSISIPPSLLISAMGQIDDVARAVTMDLKEAGNRIYIVGMTHDELGGSHFTVVHQLRGGQVPRVDAPSAKRTFAAVHSAISAGFVRACHDLSEGGLAVAIAEMAFAGGLGAKIELAAVPHSASNDPHLAAVLLFSESNTRFVCEVPAAQAAAFEAKLAGVPFAQIGEVTTADDLQVTHNGHPLIIVGLDRLKAAWQSPLNWTKN
jgi:phosphoribosylformylglycinamidine synthase